MATAYDIASAKDAISVKKLTEQLLEQRILEAVDQRRFEVMFEMVNPELTLFIENGMLDYLERATRENQQRNERDQQERERRRQYSRPSYSPPSNFPAELERTILGRIALTGYNGAKAGANIGAAVGAIGGGVAGASLGVTAGVASGLARNGAQISKYLSNKFKKTKEKWEAHGREKRGYPRAETQQELDLR